MKAPAFSERSSYGEADPMTYRLGANGKQYVVIAAGGHPKIAEGSESLLTHKLAQIQARLLS